MIDFTLTIDRSKIVSEGRRAIGEFLNGLQEAIKFIDDNNTSDYQNNETTEKSEENGFNTSSDIKIDIDF